MVSSDEAQGNLCGKLIEQLAEQIFQRLKWHGAVDDIAQEDEFARPIALHQREKARRGIIWSAERQQVALLAMRPGITKMQIGRGQNPFLGQPERPGSVEPETRIKLEK